LGFFVGEDTPFKAIRALPPGGRLAWSPGDLRVNGGAPAVAPTRPSRDAAMDDYIERFRLAMARRRPPDAPYALPLSSGRDSRHILLELCRMGCPPRLCLTGRRYPPTSREDALIAPQVARAMNVEHRFFVDPLPRFRRESAAILAQNLCADEGHWLFGVFGRLSELGPVTYHGLAGDVLSASRLLTRTGLDLFERGRLEELALHLISQWHKDEQLDRFLNPGQLARYSRDRAIARLVSELEKHRQAANPISQFYFFNRTRREIVLPPAFALAGLEMVHYPFLDRDLCDFLLSLPPGLTMDKAFHTDTILRAYPECAHVPFERADAPRARDLRAYAHRLKFLSDLAGLALLHRRDWWRANDRLLPRTLRRHLVPGRMLEANRFLQAVLYLSQLHSLAHG